MSSSVRNTAQEHLNTEQYSYKDLKHQLTYMNSKLGSMERNDNSLEIEDKFITRSRGRTVVVRQIKMKEYEVIVKALRTYHRMAINKLQTGQYAMLTDANNQKMQGPISFISTGNSSSFFKSDHVFGGSGNIGGKGGAGSAGGTGASAGAAGGYYNFGVGSVSIKHRG